MTTANAFKPLSKEDLADVLGVSIRTIENWVNEGILPAPTKLGNREVGLLFRGLFRVCHVGPFSNSLASGLSQDIYVVGAGLISLWADSGHDRGCRCC